MRDIGINFNMIRKLYDQFILSFLVYRSILSSILFFLNFLSVINNREKYEVQIGLVKVKVYNGFILDVNVRVIVNVINKSLIFDVGVFRVIRKVVGFVYEMDCKNFFQGLYFQILKCY